MTANGEIAQVMIGLPTADEANVPGVAGARVSTFQDGAIYWSVKTGAHSGTLIEVAFSRALARA